MLVRGLIVLVGIELKIARLHFQTLRGGRDHVSLLLGEEGDVLPLHVLLVLLHLLLLQVLDLRIDVGEGVTWRGRWYYIRGHRRIRGSGSHGVHLVVHGRRQEEWSICSTHGRIECLAVCQLHHMPAILVLEIAKVKVQPFREVFDAVHIEELVEFIAVSLIVPPCRLHHGLAVAGRAFVRR